MRQLTHKNFPNRGTRSSSPFIVAPTFSRKADECEGWVGKNVLMQATGHCGTARGCLAMRRTPRRTAALLPRHMVAVGWVLA